MMKFGKRVTATNSERKLVYRSKPPVAARENATILLFIDPGPLFPNVILPGDVSDQRL
jgi:hypothetical protein